jgi:predicted transcriptional regulator
MTFGRYTLFKVEVRVVCACASAAERPLQGLSSQDTFLDTNRRNE